MLVGEPDSLWPQDGDENFEEEPAIEGATQEDQDPCNVASSTNTELK